jgi:DNA-3-methyladenine glycosylase II
MHETIFTVSTDPPLRFDLTIWVLRRRAKNSIDRFDDRSYTRILKLGNTPVELAAKQIGTPKPQLEVRLRSKHKLTAKQQRDAKQLVINMFGLNIDLQPFYDLAASEPALSDLAEQFRGMRPTRYPTIFEALVNAIACQQVSLDAGISMLNRLTERYGLAFVEDDITLHAFPNPEDLVEVSEADLKQLGFSYQKARSIKGLAFGVTNGDIELGQLGPTGNEEALAYLQTIHGIGRWSAEYVLLRGLGRLDIFPGDDIGGQNNVQNLLQLGARPGYEELGKLTARWHPYAGLVYFHLLLDKLYKKGLV